MAALNSQILEMDRWHLRQKRKHPLRVQKWRGLTIMGDCSHVIISLLNYHSSHLIILYQAQWSSDTAR